MGPALNFPTATVSFPTGTLEPGNDYKVKVYNMGTPAEVDWSDNYFTVFKPDLSNWLSAPNGAEAYPVGSSFNVIINSSLYAPPNINIELYKGSSKVYGPVTGGATNRSIPTTGLVPGSDYKVRIYNKDNTAEEDWSIFPFVIGGANATDLSNWLLTPIDGNPFKDNDNINIAIDAVLYSPNQIGVELYGNSTVMRSTTIVNAARASLSHR